MTDEACAAASQPLLLGNFALQHLRLIRGPGVAEFMSV